jgi:cellulose synthase/poly-beta-1,6-N-acetylglucosamine synthase-like glycosyltransferase
MKLRLIALVSVISALALYRILPHPVNFTPVMAVALFAGARFDDRRIAFLMPLLAMLLSDLVIGLHETMLFVYAGMALAVVFGLLIRRHRGFMPVVSATVVGSVGFFVISNFGAWLYSPGLYSRDWAGLSAAYAAAIPFYQNSLLSDVVFSALLFGGWALAERTFPRLVDSRIP